MSEIDHMKKRHKELEEGNERSYKEMCEFVGRNLGMDTSDTRRELLYEKLQEWGIISEKQALEFEINFHEKVEAALNQQWIELRKQAGPQLSIVKKPTKLVDQHGRPIGD